MVLVSIAISYPHPCHTRRSARRQSGHHGGVSRNLHAHSPQTSNPPDPVYAFAQVTALRPPSLVIAKTGPFSIPPPGIRKRASDHVSAGQQRGAAGAPWGAKIPVASRSAVVTGWSTGETGWVRRGRPRSLCSACEPVGQHGGGGRHGNRGLVPSSPSVRLSESPCPPRDGHLVMVRRLGSRWS